MAACILVVGEEMGEDEPLALRKGLKLLAGGASSLHLLQVIYSEMDEHGILLEEDTRQGLREKLLRDTEQHVEDLIHQECPDTPGISYEVVWKKSVAHAVDTVCAQRNFDLIVKTGHREESLTHISTDVHLLRVPRVPVMVLNKQSWSAKPVILAAIDFAPKKNKHMALNRKVLDAARGVAGLTRARLHCCYVVAYSKALADLDVVHSDELLARFKARHEAELLDFVAEFGVEPETVHVHAGSPTKLIPSVANRVKADLVVVGTHHRSGLAGLVPGNICEKVLHVLRTAVLTVKPE